TVQTSTPTPARATTTTQTQPSATTSASATPSTQPAASTPARTTTTTPPQASAPAPVQTGPAASVQSSTSAPVQTLTPVTVVGSVDDLQSLDFLAPNSSFVLKRQDIEDQGARKLDQALHYQAGIQAEPFGADNKVEWFKIRGFDASTSIDGTPTTP